MAIKTIFTANEQDNIQNNCGCDFNTAKDWPILHNHTFFEITYIFARTKHDINSQTIWLEENTLLITRPHDVHCFSDCDETIGQLNFKISCDYFKTILNFFDDTFYDTVMNADIHELYVCMTPEYGRSVKKFLDELLMIPTLRQKYISCKFMVTKFLKIFYYHFYTSDKKVTSSIVNNAIQLLQSSKNFNTNIMDLLSGLDYSYMHIYRLFKDSTGQTPNNYFITQKLRYAANLLLYTNYKIVEIANQAGFTSQARFDTCFKKFYGITPKEYRLHGMSIHE